MLKVVVRKFVTAPAVKPVVPGRADQTGGEAYAHHSFFDTPDGDSRFEEVAIAFPQPFTDE
ncbi:MAG TPA: hypothetical protein VKK81_03240 [Candidatus Binatia bacterium]|nr:hypothetical protein [Candidatus Binatia bacterium]